jgi:hypothetical protein
VTHGAAVAQLLRTCLRRGAARAAAADQVRRMRDTASTGLETDDAVRRTRPELIKGLQKPTTPAPPCPLRHPAPLCVRTVPQRNHPRGSSLYRSTHMLMA